jgi:hypothetical protein
LPKTINDNNIPILFADDASIIIKRPNPKDFQTNMVEAFDRVNKWFKVNSLFINVKKTHYIKFNTKNQPKFDINIVCGNNLITPVINIKFLSIYLQDSINWSFHFEYIIPKKTSACYVMRSIKSIMPINTLKTVYFSHFNVIITYGLPFWGNSPRRTKILKCRKQ